MSDIETFTPDLLLAAMHWRIVNVLPGAKNEDRDPVPAGWWVLGFHNEDDDSPAVQIHIATAYAEDGLGRERETTVRVRRLLAGEGQ